MPGVPTGLTGQKARNIDKCDERNVKGIAEADKASPFHGGVDVQASWKEVPARLSSSPSSTPVRYALRATRAQPIEIPSIPTAVGQGLPHQLETRILEGHVGPKGLLPC